MWFAHGLAERHVSSAVKIASMPDNWKSAVIILHTEGKITGLQKLQSD